MKRATALVAFFAVCIPMHAAVFGPVDYIRDTGKPQELAAEFSCHVVASDFRLIVENAGRTRVSSASVTLNGEVVVRESDFHQNVATLQRAVTLRRQNRIEVRLAGAPGGTLRITIKAVAGPAGGTIGTASGTQLVIPAGALAGEVSLSLEDVPLDALGVAIPGGYSAIAAVALDLEGATLAEEADLAVPLAAPLTGRAIAARLLPLGDQTQLVLVDTASAGADGLLRTDSPPFPGIRGGGTFVLLQMPAGLGIAPLEVKNAAGAAARGSLAKLQIESTTAAPALAATANASLSAFIGEAGANGFAAVPGVPPHTRVVALGATPVANGSGLAGATQIDFGDVLTTGLLDTFVDDLIVRRLFDIDDIQPPADCDCTSLMMNPSQIPTLFHPGMARQLATYCMPAAADVTRSTSLPELEDLLSGGVSVHLTRYTSANANVATVDAGGLVTAVSLGSTSVAASVTRARLARVADVVFPRLCAAAGAVKPVAVTCPADAPFFSATRRRCEPVVILHVNGPGSVSSTPPAFTNCRSTCTGTWAKGDTLSLTATADPPGKFAFWSGACSGTGNTAIMPVQHLDTCTATFSTGSIAFDQAVCVVRYQFWPPRDLLLVRVHGPISAPYESRFRVTMELLPDAGTWWSPPVLTFYDREVRDRTEFGSSQPFGDRIANWILPGSAPYAVKVRAYLDGVQHDERTIGCSAGFEP